MTQQSQKGFSLVGIALRLLMVMFVALCALRLFPPYLENYKIQNSLDRLHKNKSLAKIEDEMQYHYAIKNAVAKQWRIEDVRTVNTDQITISKVPVGHQVQVAYVTETPFAYNITLKIRFAPTVILRD